MKDIRQRRHTKAERDEILGEFCESGVSQREFCAEHRIGLSTLQYWLRKTRELEDADEAAAIRPFVEVRLEAASEARWKVDGSSQMAEYDLVLPSGRRLVVRSGFNREEVAGLIELLERL